MKKSMKSTVLVVLACGALVGCASGGQGQIPENQTTEAAKSGENVSTNKTTTITFWDGNWQESVWPEVEALWNAEHPDIKVEAEFQADLANDKYMLALTNGTAPDVMSCALDWITTFGSAELLAPLDEYVTRDSLDVNQFVAGANQASTIGGKLYGLPFRSETHVLFYNKDILEAAGYSKAPETWEEVKEVAAACTKDGVYGYGLCGTNYSNFSFQYINMLRSSGGNLLSEDNAKSEFNSDIAIQTAQMYKDLMAYAPASLLENDNVANRTLFASGKIAMYCSGIYDVEVIQETNPELNFACAMLPTSNGAERNTILGGWSVAIPECSKEKEAAWEFVKFLTRPDVAAIYTNTFTGTAEVAERYVDCAEDIVKPNADALEYATALPNVKNIVGIRQAIMDNLQLMLSDDVSAEEACALLDEATNALLD